MPVRCPAALFFRVHANVREASDLWEALVAAEANRLAHAPRKGNVLVLRYALGSQHQEAVGIEQRQ